MDILNFISWIKGKRQVTTVDPTKTVLAVGIKDPKRDDQYLAGAITVEDFADVVGPLVPAGPAGPQGVAGPAGVPGPVGPAGLEWQGSWVSGASYVEDDAVGYDGASYFCILATTGTTEPDLDTTHWALLASQGAIGPQGPQGPQGQQGPSGNPISYLEYNDTDKTVWNNGKGDIQSNTSFGENVLQLNTTGSSNTGYGFNALSQVTSGSGNTAMGYAVMSILGGAGSNNTAFGSAAGFLLSSGSNNIFVGGQAGLNCTTGSGNIIIGTNANIASASQSFGTAIGNGAVASAGSVVIGSGATSGASTNCVVLGIGATATGSNQFVVGSSTQAAGAVTTETVSSTKTWTVVINGTTHKILLA
jgi:hypothetical protein